MNKVMLYEWTIKKKIIWWGERVCVVSIGREKVQGVIRNSRKVQHLHQIIVSGNRSLYGGG